MDYQKLWDRYRKRIQASSKRIYSKNDVLNIFNGLEAEEHKAEATRNEAIRRLRIKEGTYDKERT